jgi:hypothetical protein
MLTALGKEKNKNKNIDFYSIRWFLGVRAYLFWTVLFFVSIVLILALGVYPSVKKSLDMNKQIKEVVLENEKLSKKVKELNSYNNSEDYEVLEKSDEILYSVKPIMELMSVYPYISGQDDSFVGVEKFDISPGLVSTDSASLENKKSKEDFVLFSLDVYGKKENVTNYFKKIEKLSPLMTVSSLQITNRNEELVNGQADILLHFYDPQENLELATSLPKIDFDQEAILDLMKNIEKLDIDLNQDNFVGGKEDPFQSPLN